MSTSSTGLEWNRYAVGDPRGTLDPIDDVHYGPDIPTEAELRLLGNLADRRVLELGCGGGQCLVALARKGAHAIGLDHSPEQLNAAKRLSELEGVKVEVHRGDLADLAFLRADSVDLVLSCYGLTFVTDLNRLFRQVHRVLKQGSCFVFSLPHPAYQLLDDTRPGPPVVRHSYFDRSGPGAANHGFSDLFSGLSRAKFRIDALLEPEPVPSGPRTPWWRESFRLVPPTLVIRARKEGT